MVKVNGPMMSMDASGSLGGSVVFSKWKGRNYVRSLTKPANPKTPLQVSMRAMFKFLSQNWAALSSADKATWETKADQLVASTFNAYMSVNQDRWRNFLLPSAQDPPVGGVSDTIVGDMSATAGVRSITLHWELAETSNTAWGTVIYRSTTSGFTPGLSNVLAVVYSPDSVGTDYVDAPLDPGTYYYRFGGFDTNGAYLLQATEQSATVT